MSVIRFLGVSAVPLKNGETDPESNVFDYEMSWGKKGLMVDTSLELSECIKKTATAIASGWPLSYKYKEDDITFFEVRFKCRGGKNVRTFAFLTGVPSNGIYTKEFKDEKTV